MPSSLLNILPSVIILTLAHPSTMAFYSNMHHIGKFSRNSIVVYNVVIGPSCLLFVKLLHRKK